MTEEEHSSEEVTTTKKRKRVDDVEKRKRGIFSLPLTPFMLFAGSIRETILRKNPTGTPVDLGRLIVAEWKKLTSEHKKMYQDISVSDKEAYGKRSNVSEVEKKEEEKKKKSAYEYYDTIARKRFKQLNPNATSEKLKELSILGWKNLPTSQKRSFQDLARQDIGENDKVERSKTTIKIPITKDKASSFKKQKLKPLIVPNSNTTSVKGNTIKSPPPPTPPFVMSPMGIRSTSPVPGGMMMYSPPAFPHLPFFPPGMPFPPHPPQVGTQRTPGRGGGKNGNVTSPQTPQNMMAAAAAAAAMISPKFAMQMSTMNPMIGFPVSPNLHVPPATSTNTTSNTIDDSRSSNSTTTKGGKNKN